jgi:hypothetical protein
MNMETAISRVVLLVALTVSNASVPSIALADCYFPNDGQVVSIRVESCEVIDGRTNKDVLKNSRLPNDQTIQKLYTGALVTGDRGMKWMYPSTTANPCQQFPKSTLVRMSAYRTCCDTGAWGKCVFGGRWLGDVEGKPVNAFQ